MTVYIISIYVYVIYTQYIPESWAMAIQWYPCVATLLEFPNMKKTIVGAINSPKKCDQSSYISKFPYHLNPKPQHLSGFRRWNVWSCSEVTILPAFGPGVPGVPMIPSSYWGTPMTIETSINLHFYNQQQKVILSNERAVVKAATCGLNSNKDMLTN